MAEAPCWIAAFAAWADRRPDAVALGSGAGRATSYGALLARAEALRAALRAGGLEAGEGVALLLPSGADLVAAFYAAASLGAIATPLDPELTRYELSGRLGLARPALALTTPAALAAHGGALAASEGLRLALVLAGEGPAPASPGGELRLLPGPGEGAPRSALESPPAEAVVSCHFTYKGIGQPLGALHRSRAYAFTARAQPLALGGADAGDRVLAALPLHPVFGFTTCAIAPLAQGVEVLLPSGGPRQLYEALRDPSLRFACLVPPVLRVLVGLARRAEDGPLSKELRIVTGGSALPDELAQAAAEVLGALPLQGYGLTEALPITATRPGEARVGTVGTPLAPEVRLAVRDAFGRDVPAGRAGEVHVAGPTVTAGYLRRPRETARFVQGEWLRTGDLGLLEPEDGHLRLLGRREPFTKVSAQMVDLVEVEQAIAEHPAVTDVCAYPRPGSKGEDELCVAVALRGRTAVRLGELLTTARERLSPHKVPKRIKVYRASLAEDAADR